MRIFERLTVEFPEKEIFFRLGGHCVKTQLNDRDKMQFMQISRTAFELCAPQGRWLLLKIEDTAADGVYTGDGFWQLGEKFTETCGNAAFLWCGAVTVGSEITDARDKCKSAFDSTIYDAVGSECADAAMDMLSAMSRRELRRSGMMLAERRFSPGYGDMSLELQPKIFRLLNMESMGITLNEYNFLFPEKSVTAFAFVNSMQENNL